MEMIIKLLNFILLYFIFGKPKLFSLMYVSRFEITEKPKEGMDARKFFFSIFYIRETCIIEKYMYALARQQDPHYLLSYMCVDGYKGGLRGPTCFVGSRNRIVVNTHCETRVTLNNKSISRDKDGPWLCMDIAGS